MATFVDTGDSSPSAAQTILNASRPGSSAPQPQPVFPVEGFAAAIASAPKNNPQSCVCKGGSLLAQSIYAEYNGSISPGPTVGPGTPLPYVLSDVINQGKYRLVLDCSVTNFEAAGAATPSLWLVPPGPLPSKVDGTDAFFLNFAGVANKNAGPPARGIRIDSSQSDAATTENFDGQTIGMMPPCGFILVPPGWCLMAYCENNTTTPGLGSYLILRVLYAEFPLSTDIEF